ncbi:hypothetical protein AGDE_14405 [Angomonas deanei]|uniref:Uncharacterized protein n=1 Tax=Angomonas deanei TaxID=59799 RepID=A0A7G2CQW4_9TRYP|nr:hypothetical protein AGDE_14405 [Angomonas deanei]CAD2222150.1 hypothetical protein, conserved [Angomonas deanei]|eukprot:EPY20878.1 hypothetical protein AGDE_14405 [Angomonas deanei]
MDTISHAWSIVRGVSLSEAVLHRSTVEGQTPITIDYPYLQHLFGTSKYALTAADGQMEAQLLAFVGPFLQLRVDPTSAAKDNLLKELECDVADEATTAALAAKGNANPLEAALTAVTDVVRSAVGLTGARSVRFTAPHMNLSIVTSKLEKDIAEFLSLIEKRIHACRSAGSGKNIMKDDIMFVLAVGEYLSEVLATVAVLYRSTAMLQLDDHGGHREWLLAQSFCASSEERRKKLLFELRLQSSAEKVLQTTNDLDNYSTHPAVLMNAAARPCQGGRREEEGDR